MQPTPYDEINTLIAELQAGICAILGQNILGMYLEGSLVWGDFDHATSDIDLLAVTTAELTDAQFAALDALHAAFARAHPAWDDRIEVCYMPAWVLRSVRTTVGPIANISPGEPFHRLESRKEWLMNWYLTRKKGQVLFGPPPAELIEPISRAEFVACVRDHARSWDEWVLDMRSRYAQSYAILSMCRALYSVRTGDQVSKKQAALWAIDQLPAWRETIQNGLDWKAAGRDRDPDEIHFPRTEQFVLYVRQLILDTQGDAP